MFSGIVQEFSKKTEVKSKDYGINLSVRVTKKFTKGLKKGDSVAVNGVCLTVKKFNSDTINFDVIHESLKLTNLKSLNSDLPLNLERSLKMGDEIGGHLVSGHIHSKGKILDFKKSKETLLKIELPKSIKGYILKKGYVALNGISLTVVNVDSKSFSVSLIPETLENTNLKFLKKGDLLNIEADQQTVAIVETIKKLR
ncbi:MAG: riboflavin synthase [Gammaproteobacteria bacterium]|jgi:riboflavin synthase|nr:riboflavin synthase [Gammaproteobacteria bacterium]|tara:strand:+ start:149 stop:742 length:594 start_codon:yes stop_codon:yes gene_type:complete